MANLFKGNVIVLHCQSPSRPSLTACPSQRALVRPSSESPCGGETVAVPETALPLSAYIHPSVRAGPWDEQLTWADTARTPPIRRCSCSFSRLSSSLASRSWRWMPTRCRSAPGASSSAANGTLTRRLVSDSRLTRCASNGYHGHRRAGSGRAGVAAGQQVHRRQISDPLSVASEVATDALAPATLTSSDDLPTTVYLIWTVTETTTVFIDPTSTVDSGSSSYTLSGLSTQAASDTFSTTASSASATAGPTPSSFPVVFPIPYAFTCTGPELSVGDACTADTSVCWSVSLSPCDELNRPQ